MGFLGKALSGLAGAGAGFLTGGPAGAALGGLGGLASSRANDTRIKNLPNMSPQQNQLLEQILGSLKGRQQFTQDNPLYNQGSDVLSMLLSGQRDASACLYEAYKALGNDKKALE